MPDLYLTSGSLPPAHTKHTCGLVRPDVQPVLQTLSLVKLWGPTGIVRYKASVSDGQNVLECLFVESLCDLCERGWLQVGTVFKLEEYAFVVSNDNEKR